MAKRELLPALRRALSPARETKGLDDRVRASSSAYVVPGIPYSQNWNVRRAVAEGYEGNPLVYRAVEVICHNAVAQRVILRVDDPDDGKMITQSSEDPTRLIYVLNKRANPWETALIFRHRLVAQFLLSSRGVFIEVSRTRSGRIGFLNIIDPDLVDMVPSQTDPINAFRIRTPNSSNSYDYLPRFDPDADAENQPTAILWIRSPHPLVMWEGMSPVQAAGLSIDLDKYARLYNRRFLQNDGRPGGLLAVKGSLRDESLEIIQAQFTGGVESAGRTAVIQADAVSYADTSGSPRDMMWGELSNATQSDIAMVFGVPESVLGDASGRTFDNADAEYAMFWEHRMLPLLRMLDDQLDVLTGGYDDDLYLRHDLSKVWVLGRYKREAQDRAAADLERGAITYDEYREVIERSPWNVPASRVAWIPAGKLAVGMAGHEHDAKEAAASPVGGPVTAASAGEGPPGGVGLDALPGGGRAALPAGSSGGSDSGSDGDGLRSSTGFGSNSGDSSELERAYAVNPKELEGKKGGPRYKRGTGNSGAADWR